MIQLLRGKIKGSSFVVGPVTVANFELAFWMIILKAGASPGKYGVVSVYNIDGTLNREYKITSQELATLRASGNGVPTGCTAEEWTSGHAIVAGNGMDVGDIEQRIDGSLALKYSESIISGKFKQSFVIFASGEWSGTPPLITVSGAVLATIPGTPITSIVNGVLEGK